MAWDPFYSYKFIRINCLFLIILFCYRWFSLIFIDEIISIMRSSIGHYFSTRSAVLMFDIPYHFLRLAVIHRSSKPTQLVHANFVFHRVALAIIKPEKLGIDLDHWWVTRSHRPVQSEVYWLFMICKQIQTPPLFSFTVGHEILVQNVHIMNEGVTEVHSRVFTLNLHLEEVLL